MRIAYVSFEFPQETAFGGIAAYVSQVAKLMKDRGHEVEVFSASLTRSTVEDFNGILVHRVLTKSRANFPEDVLPIFQSRHEQNFFDVLESPEYSGDGIKIKKNNPGLPLVVKLHAPSFMLNKLDTLHLTKFDKFRFRIGGIIKNDKRIPYWIWKKKEEDIEYQITVLADQIQSPSTSLREIVSKRWQIKRNRILLVPNPFIPNESFLNIPINTEFNKVTFIGRLEYKKGITFLTKAIPAIIKAVPGVKFSIIGKDCNSHIRGLTMRRYMENELKSYLDRISFEQVTLDEIPKVLSLTDVCVFPSLWDNFPNACLEAMSAGRAIIGGYKGGMKDMLEETSAGILINPTKPNEIANAVIRVLTNKELRLSLGDAARQKALTAYNSEVVGELIEKNYSLAINKLKRFGS